jgi:hypothetical protein
MKFFTILWTTSLSWAIPFFVSIFFIDEVVWLNTFSNLFVAHKKYIFSMGGLIDFAISSFL